MVAEDAVEGVVEGTIEGTMANHCLHVSIVDRLIIIMTLVGISFSNLIGLPILPLVIFLPLYPRE